MTQRVGTIMGADRIVVLDGGTIVGVGTHQELMATCETTARSCTHSSARRRRHERPAGAGAGASPAPSRHGRWWPFGGPGLHPKPKNFKGTFRRLIGTLQPEAPRIVLVIIWRSSA